MERSVRTKKIIPCGWLSLIGFIVVLCASTLPLRSAMACDSCYAAGRAAGYSASIPATITAASTLSVQVIGQVGGGIGSAIAAASAAIPEIEKSKVESIFAHEMIAATRGIAAKNALNTQSTNCKLALSNRLDNSAKRFANEVVEKNEDSLLDLLNDGNKHSALRLAIGHLYRLCQNGQLAPDDLGSKWFAANKCIDDPRTARDFLKMSTIFDSRILVQPSQAQMTILDNPASSTPATVLTTWNALNDKQKKYVGAMRFCETLIIGYVRPNEIKNDATADTLNMAILGANNARGSVLQESYDICMQAVARRTGLDPVTQPPSAERTALEQNGMKIGYYLVGKRGYPARSIYAYSNNANYDSNTPILLAGKPKIFVSPYLLDLQQYVYSMSMECVGYANQGSESGKSSNALECQRMALNWEKAEAREKTRFIRAINTSLPVLEDAITAPTRAGYTPTTPAAPLMQDAALTIPGFEQPGLPLAELLGLLTNSTHPEQTAAAKPLLNGDAP
jgi:hypothetical protein